MRKTDAWDQVDPDRNSPNLEEPRRPVPGDIKGKETLPRNQTVAPIPPIPYEDMFDTKISDLSADEKLEWQQSISIWELEYKKWNKKDQAYREMYAEIQKTVDSKFLDLTFDKETAYDMMVSLQEYFKPTTESMKLQLQME